MSFWTLLYALVHSHVGTGRGHPQTVPTNWFSTALESSGCFTPLHPTLCIALGDVWLGCSCSAMETHSMKLYMHCCWANLKATWSLEVCSDWLCRKLATSAHSASADPAPSFYVAYHFVTVDCGIFRSEDISRLDLLRRWHPITVPRWNSLSSWERPILSQMFVETGCMPWCLILYTCGHWSDWITWFQSFGWLGEYCVFPIFIWEYFCLFVSILNVEKGLPN